MATPAGSPSTSNTPQAKNDLFSGAENGTITLDVMANDLGGNGKSLYSIHQSSPHTVATTALSAMGATISVAGGKVTYVANSASINALARGETAVDTFTYTIQLGNGALSTATVSVTVTGTNDAPVVTGVVTGSAVEDGTGVTLNALANASDVDAGTVLSIVNLPASLPEGVSFDAAAGAFTLNPQAGAYQSLGVGQTTTVTVSYGVSDGVTTAPASVSWIVTGTNDGPVAGADADAATEDGGGIAVNVLSNDTDADSGDTKTLVSVNAAGTVGVVAANADGTVTYNPGPNFQSLGAGQTTTDTFSYTMKDAAGATSTATVTMTITGTNDGPAAVADAGSGNEDDAAIVVNVLGNDTDIDAGDTKTLVSVTNGTYGTVTANPDGTVTYNVPAIAQTLSAGESGTDTFTYTMRDSAGATSTATVTVTVVGRNDAPTVGAPGTVAAGGVTEIADGAPGENASQHAVSGAIAIADPDDEDVHVVTSVVPAGPGYVGFFTFEPDPANDQINWTFRVQDGALDGLGAGQTKVQTYTVNISDGQGGTTSQVVTITLTGTNDAPTTPVDSNAAANQVAENAASGTLVGLVASASDVDGSAPTYSLVLGDGSTALNDGRFAIDPATGVVSVFDGTKLDYEAATSHQITVRATDASGASASSAFNIGVADVAEASARFAPRVLFVDDDEGRNTSDTWMSSLRALGYDVTYEAISVTGNPTSNLASFDVVIWSVSDRAYTNLTAQNVATITGYLNGGGKLLYAGGHNLYEEPNAAGLAANYFGVNNYDYNMPYVDQQAHIHAAGPGGTAYTLSDFSDNPGLTSHYGGTMMSAMNAFGTAQTMLEMTTGGAHAGHSGSANFDPTYNDLAVFNTNGVFRTAVWGFDLNQLDPDFRMAFLDQTLQLLAGQSFSNVWNGPTPKLAQLLVNNTFSNPTNVGAVTGFSSIEGWTNNNGALLELCDSTVYNVGGDGQWLDTQASPGGINISQAVDLLAGQTATLTINVAKVLTAGLHPGSTLTFSFNGQTVLSLTEASFTDWNQLQTFSVSLTGRAGADVLTIQDSGGGSVGYALDWVKLDGWVF